MEDLGQLMAGRRVENNNIIVNGDSNADASSKNMKEWQDNMLLEDIIINTTGEQYYTKHLPTCFGTN